MAAKLIVTKARGGSRISLIGTSGKELMASKVFTEPRGKGATLRSLKALLGEGVEIDDQTLAVNRKTAAASETETATAAAAAPAATPKRTRAVSAKGSTKRSRRK